MAADNEILECVEACRTCGIFFLTTSNFLRQIFVEDLTMHLIRREFEAWNMEIRENDGFPQYMCTGCIDEFQKLFKFRRSCVDVQGQWRHIFHLREENLIKVKSEPLDPREVDEEKNCDFIYVDDLSDDEGDKAIVTPFTIPHAPMKEEIIEEAVVPPETNEDFSSSPSFSTKASNEQGTLAAVQPEHLNVKEEKSLIEDVQQEPAQIQCDLCLHISTDQKQHREHTQLKHETKDLKCHICGKMFQNSRLTRLKFHLKWHKISRHIKCAQCSFMGDSRETLKQHVRTTHTKSKCPECGKFFLLRKMEGHRCNLINKIECQCCYCPKVFNNETERNEHIWQIHTQNDKDDTKVVEDNPPPTAEVICANCEQTFENKKSLEIHILEAHPTHATQRTSVVNSDYTPARGKAAPSQDKQNVYESILNTDTIPLQYINDNYNSMPINSERHPIYHNATSNTDVTNNETIDDDANNKYVCAQCDEIFSTIPELCEHHKIHLKKVGFDCHICGKLFALKFSLNRHLKKHKAPF